MSWLPCSSSGVGTRVSDGAVGKSWRPWLLLLSLSLMGLAVFGGPFQKYPLEFLCIPPLVWAAFRFGQREAATATFVLSGIALWGTLRGFGPFGVESPHESLLLLQAFMGVIAVMIIALAAVVSERRRVEQALREINAELEAFTSSVSHDLRAPLRALQGIGQALLEDYGDRLDPIGQDYAQRPIAAAERMDTMIQELLACNRLSRTDLRLQRVDLGPVMTEVLTQMKGELEGREAQVRVEARLPEVVGHHATLVQVVANLLTNAVKFVSPEVQPRVRVWADERDEWVRLCGSKTTASASPRNIRSAFFASSSVCTAWRR